jgi:hypothetical protein
VKRETILPGALQTNSALTKTSDKSDKTSLKASPDGVLSLLSSLFGSRKRLRSLLDLILPRASAVFTVDSVATPERLMSGTETPAE